MSYTNDINSLYTQINESTHSTGLNITIDQTKANVKASFDDIIDDLTTGHDEGTEHQVIEVFTSNRDMIIDALNSRDKDFIDKVIDDGLAFTMFGALAQRASEEQIPISITDRNGTVIMTFDDIEYRSFYQDEIEPSDIPDEQESSCSRM